MSSQSDLSQAVGAVLAIILIPFVIVAAAFWQGLALYVVIRDLGPFVGLGWTLTIPQCAAVILGLSVWRAKTLYEDQEVHWGHTLAALAITPLVAIVCTHLFLWVAS